MRPCVQPARGGAAWRVRPLAAGLLALPLWATPALALDYPEAPRGDVVDDYHGTAVADPYRWLEDTDSAQTRAWVQAQQALAADYLEELPGRAAVESQLRQIWDRPRQGLPQTVAERRYFLFNDGLLPQPLLLVEPVGGGAREVVLDINRKSADGGVALKRWRVDPHGRYLAYGLTEAGEDWTRIRIRDLASGRDLGEELRHVKFSNIAWTADGEGFFYSRYPAREGTFDALADQAVWYHRVGSPQSADVRVYANPKQPQHGYWAEVDASGRWLLISVREGASDANRLLLRDLRDGQDPELFGPTRTLVGSFAHRQEPIGVLDDELYVITTADAPRGRVRALLLTDPRAQWVEVVPQSQDTLQNAVLAGGLLIVHTLRDAASQLAAYTPIGEPRFDLTPPGLAVIDGLAAEAGRREVFYRRSALVEPDAVWRADLASGDSGAWQQATFDFPVADFVTERLQATSADGTPVPYFLARARTAQPDQPRPTWLYGYGGFNIPITPEFRVTAPLWLRAGGIYVLANLRGGGEFGKAWHEAGTKQNKQRVFDDFIAVAEDLIARGWASPDTLAIHGRSNGGLLVGAVVNQRPELYGAALAGVGVMDMLRFHRFTIGWAWTGDYGSSEDPAQFRALRAYSPYHNVRGGRDYPPLLAYTADHDDRVVPGHSYKYMAALQHADTGAAPKLLRIESRGGHGAGKPTAARIAEARDLLLFAGYHTGLEWPRTASQTRWQRLTGR